MNLLIGAGLALATAGAAFAASRASAPVEGERIYRRCFACHALEPGRNTPAGPTLHAIVGRPIAAEPGFDYSPALRRLAARRGRWTPELLDRFITDPGAVAPGTEMGFLGIPDPHQRRILIAWLSGNRPAPGRD